MTELEKKFDDKMRYICTEAKKHGYNPSMFSMMVNTEGGVKTAKKLVVQSKPTDGFIKLWSMNRLDFRSRIYKFIY